MFGGDYFCSRLVPRIRWLTFFTSTTLSKLICLLQKLWRKETVVLSVVLLSYWLVSQIGYGHGFSSFLNLCVLPVKSTLWKLSKKLVLSYWPEISKKQISDKHSVRMQSGVKSPRSRQNFYLQNISKLLLSLHFWTRSRFNSWLGHNVPAKRHKLKNKRWEL